VITGCRHCAGQIRDCSIFRPAGPPVFGWYHTTSGAELCPGGDSVAAPLPLINVACPHGWPVHAGGCHLCATVASVQTQLHNDRRCIPRTCPLPHLEAA
jgi:hypothetical protein